MSIITNAIYDILSEDADLAGILADYNGSPAIFTTDPAPSDFSGDEYIIIPDAYTQTPFDTKTSVGFDITHDIRCYTKDSGSAVVIETISHRVYVLLHRQTLVIDNYDHIFTDCSGPVRADEPEYYGRIVTVRALIEYQNDDVLFEDSTFVLFEDGEKVEWLL